MAITPFLTTVFKPALQLGFWSQTAWAILRVVIGVMMVYHGLEKLADIESFSRAYVEFLGFPFPIFFSYVAALTEVVAAPMVAIGFLTRPAALGLVATMSVALYHHLRVAGLNLPYLELSAIYAACFLLFAINGAGLFSTDALIAHWLDANALSTQAKRIMRLERAYQATGAPKEPVDTAVG